MFLNYKEVREHFEVSLVLDGVTRVTHEKEYFHDKTRGIVKSNVLSFEFCTAEKLNRFTKVIVNKFTPWSVMGDMKLLIPVKEDIEVSVTPDPQYSVLEVFHEELNKTV